MRNITINFKKNTIEISKSFEKKACIYGTDEYKALCDARREFPSFRLVIKTPKSKNIFKDMDFDFMKNYISKHDENSEIMNEFNKLMERALPLGEIKQWFFEIYPTFKSCKTRADWILAA